MRCRLGITACGKCTSGFADSVEAESHAFRSDYRLRLRGCRAGEPVRAGAYCGVGVRPAPKAARASSHP